MHLCVVLHMQTVSLQRAVWLWYLSVHTALSRHRCLSSWSDLHIVLPVVGLRTCTCFLRVHRGMDISNPCGCGSVPGVDAGVQRRVAAVRRVMDGPGQRLPA